MMNDRELYEDYATSRAILAEKHQVLLDENKRLRQALGWIHAYLGSECDWDDLDDGNEVDWYVNTGALLEEFGAASGGPEQP